MSLYNPENSIEDHFKEAHLHELLVNSGESDVNVLALNEAFDSENSGNVPVVVLAHEMRSISVQYDRVLISEVVDADLTMGNFQGFFGYTEEVPVGNGRSFGRLAIGAVVNDFNHSNFGAWIPVSRTKNVLDVYSELAGDPLAEKINDVIDQPIIDLHLLADLCHKIDAESSSMWLYEAFIRSLVIPHDRLESVYASIHGFNLQETYKDPYMTRFPIDKRSTFSIENLNLDGIQLCVNIAIDDMSMLIVLADDFAFELKDIDQLA